MGQGPQEYTGINAISGVVFDEEKEEIFVSDIATYSFLVYSIHGKYKRSLKYSTKMLSIDAYNFDDEAILVHNNDGLLSDSYKKSDKPYMLMSKKDGSIVFHIDIRLPVRYSYKKSERIDLGGGQIVTTGFSIPTFKNMMYGGNFVIADLLTFQKICLPNMCGRLLYKNIMKKGFQKGRS